MISVLQSLIWILLILNYLNFASAGVKDSTNYRKIIAKDDNINEVSDGKSYDNSLDEDEIRKLKIQNDNKHTWKRILPTRLTEKLFEHFFSIFLNDPDILRSCGKVCSWILWSFFVLSLLGTVGVDTKPLLSLLSISGLTIGFAAKDILTNTFAGIFILFTRPFKRGWIISVCGYRGRVVSTDIRYLRLENLKDKSEILVPLSLVYQNAIIVEQKT